MKSINSSFAQMQRFEATRERVLSFVIAGLFMLGVFLSNWTLQVSKLPPIVQLDRDEHVSHDEQKIEEGNSSRKIQQRKEFTEERHESLSNPSEEDGSQCQKRPRVPLSKDPTFKERFNGGINGWEQHPDLTGSAWATIIASPLLLTSAPVVAVAAVGVATWLFVRGALGAC